MTEIIETKLLPKDSLNDWLSSLTEYDLFGPVQRDKYSEFAKIDDLQNLNLNIRNSIIPPKVLSFPQTLTMLKYKINKTPPELVVDPTGVENDQINKQIILVSALVMFQVF